MSTLKMKTTEMTEQRNIQKRDGKLLMIANVTIKVVRPFRIIK